jgi:HlyD family secretion protein
MAKIPRWLQILAILGFLGLAAVLLRPAPIPVQTGLIESRPFFEAVEAQGRTRAINPFIVAAPIAGRLLRTDLDEGDAVAIGDVVARIAPTPQDPRSLAFAQANLTAAEARSRAAEAALVEAESAFERANRELARREELFSNNLASVEETDLYRQLAVAEQARSRSAEASLLAAMADIESARSFLLGAGPSSNSDEASIIEITAPVTGTIYNVLEENERVILAGTALFEISDQDKLEVIVDLLTQDAIKIEAGDTAYITGWGGDQTINGIVRVIEPEAFTKISALGVEEQRVNVIADVLNPPANLGAEYRLEVAIVTWQANQALTIPTSAIFQRSNGWNTFVVSNNTVAIKSILIGARSRDYTRIIGGIGEGERVILYPSDLIAEGTSVSY